MGKSQVTWCLLRMAPGGGQLGRSQSWNAPHGHLRACGHTRVSLVPGRAAGRFKDKREAPPYERLRFPAASLRSAR